MQRRKLTTADLKYIAPNARPSIIRKLVKSFSVLEEYGIADTHLRLAHFLAQAALETAGFRTLNEYGSNAYFRRRYGNRRDLGNRSRADGARYHGRGIFQLTGRANYRHYGRLINVDLENRPELAARPDISLRIACVYWNSKKLSRYADANNIRKITKRINGGYNGLSERRRYFSKAFKRLKSYQFTQASADSVSSDIIRRGMFGRAVLRLQKALNKAGFTVLADGIFGSRTQKALKAFQKKMGLRADGLAGRRTRKLLFRSLKKQAKSSSITTTLKGHRTMINWKSYLESRTLWANLIGFMALLLDVLGFASVGAEEQETLINGILKLIEASSFVMSAIFRYIAKDKLAVNI